MVGRTSVTSPWWCEADSLGVPRQAELTEGMARKSWREETQVFCCRHRYSFLTALLETLLAIGRLQLPRTRLPFPGVFQGAGLSGGLSPVDALVSNPTNKDEIFCDHH